MGIEGRFVGRVLPARLSADGLELTIVYAITQSTLEACRERESMSGRSLDVFAGYYVVRSVAETESESTGLCYPCVPALVGMSGWDLTKSWMARAGYVPEQFGGVAVLVAAYPDGARVEEFFLEVEASFYEVAAKSGGTVTRVRDEARGRA